ncbi:alpha/beta fold hydrolase [Planctobacterium marinum]
MGTGEKTLLFAHGFGCDQQMWRFLTPKFGSEYQLILFDYVGSGKSDYSAFDENKYSSLKGYAQDVLDVCECLNLQDVIFFGHSVSSIIGMHAALISPETFSRLIMVCPSPCFLNFPPDYLGGFDREDLEELINLMDKNYIGWANYLAPLVMGQNSDKGLIDELGASFCSTDPKYSKTFAKTTFFSDDRTYLSQISHPTLILQSSEDNLASVDIGKYMNTHIKNSKLEIIKAHGHCLHMTDPDKVYERFERFVTC